MSISINGTTITEVKLNGTTLEKIILDGTTILEGVPPYYNELKSGTTLTEAQWLAFLDGGGIKYIIDKGETSTFLGKKVKLTNTAESTYKTWSIGDFNHDYTSNTVDLILDNNIRAQKFGYSSKYNYSNVRNWLIITYYNGFSTDVKNKLQTMIVDTNDTTVNDNVKLLSFTEVNGSSSSSSYQYITEGFQYPIFTDNNSRIRTGAVSTSWWLRSRRARSVSTSSDDVWSVSAYSGVLNGYAYTYEFGLVPCIRFA